MSAPIGGAVLLAAGFSRRFGSDKRRHRLAGGDMLMIATARRLAAAFEHLVVVLRPEDDALAAALLEAQLPAALQIVRCGDASDGMGRSLAAGAAAAHAAGWHYLFVALADMAWVDPATLTRLREALIAAQATDPSAIVQPEHDGRPGHPVGFASGWFDQLERLQGDAGARHLLQRPDAMPVRVAVADPGVLRDLDRPEPGT
ncbi:MAG: nucleotidyltransferase family protein [Pseudomonadales bacterium]